MQAPFPQPKADARSSVSVLAQRVSSSQHFLARRVLVNAVLAMKEDGHAGYLRQGLTPENYFQLLGEEAYEALRFEIPTTPQILWNMLANNQMEGTARTLIGHVPTVWGRATVVDAPLVPNRLFLAPEIVARFAMFTIESEAVHVAAQDPEALADDAVAFGRLSAFYARQRLLGQGLDIPMFFIPGEGETMPLTPAMLQGVVLDSEDASTPLLRKRLEQKNIRVLVPTGHELN